MMIIFDFVCWWFLLKQIYSHRIQTNFLGHETHWTSRAEANLSFSGSAGAFDWPEKPVGQSSRGYCSQGSSSTLPTCLTTLLHRKKDTSCHRSIGICKTWISSYAKPSLHVFLSLETETLFWSMAVLAFDHLSQTNSHQKVHLLETYPSMHGCNSKWFGEKLPWE